MESKVRRKRKYAFLEPLPLEKSEVRGSVVVSSDTSLTESKQARQQQSGQRLVSTATSKGPSKESPEPKTRKYANGALRRLSRTYKVPETLTSNKIL